MPIERNYRVIATGEIVYAQRFPIRESEHGKSIGEMVGLAINDHLKGSEAGVLQRVTVKFVDDEAL